MFLNADLSRKQAKPNQLSDALTGLAKLGGHDEVHLLMELIEAAQQKPDSNLAGLGKLLVKKPRADLQQVHQRIENLATTAKSADIKRVAYAVWVAGRSVDSWE